MRGSLRYGVLVYDPIEADINACIVGAYRRSTSAQIKAVTIRRALELAGADDLEAVVVPVLPGNTSARDIAKEVTNRSTEGDGDAPREAQARLSTMGPDGADNSTPAVLARTVLSDYLDSIRKRAGS